MITLRRKLRAGGVIVWFCAGLVLLGIASLGGGRSALADEQFSGSAGTLDFGYLDLILSVGWGDPVDPPGVVPGAYRLDGDSGDSVRTYHGLWLVCCPSPFSVGTVTVTDPGTTLTLNEFLDINSGTGVLSIRNGATVTVGGNGAGIGGSGGSTGVVTVEGGGHLNVTDGGLAIAHGNVGGCCGVPGALTSGVLNVHSGGQVTVSGGIGVIQMGGATGATGALNVRGVGSSFTTTRGVDVGFGFGGAGFGAVTVAGGGQLTTDGPFTGLGSGPGTHGTALVTDSGSQWSIAQGLTVGGGGTGTLTITDGGVTNLHHLEIGTFGSIGLATVSGAGSQITVSTAVADGGIQVGMGGGVGVLVVRDGAAVSVTGPRPVLVVAREAGSSGTMNVTGGASVVLTSTDGQTNNLVARDPASIGRLTVAGSTSLLQVPKLLTLGLGSDGFSPGGVANLILAGGATVAVVDPGGLNGKGTLRLGPSAVLQGVGGVDANVDTSVGGTIVPGFSPGVLSISGNLNVGHGKLVLEVDGNGAHDVLQVAGSITLDPLSQIVVVLDPVFQPVAGQTLQLLQSGTGQTLAVTTSPTGSVELQISPSLGAVDRLSIEVHPVTTPSGPITVPIDIRPGTFPNTIKLGSNGIIPVAILTSPALHASKVDPSTITLAGGHVRLVGKGGKSTCTATDVNGDGDLDLLCYIHTGQLQLRAGDAVAILEGKTFAGTPIHGEDSVRIVP